MDDPKKRYQPAPREAQPEELKADAPVTQSDFLVAVKTLIDGLKTASPAEAERAALEAERLLLERERASREMPENKQAPGISVYSNPDGDLKDPKPALKCKMFWCGYRLTNETLTPLEVSLLNRLEPGEFRVTKLDGAVIPFRVSAKRNDRFEVEEMEITFPCTGTQKANHAGMVSYMTQALGEKIPSVDELMARVTSLQAELAAARVA
jgi:hypothetical protein